MNRSEDPFFDGYIAQKRVRVLGVILAHAVARPILDRLTPLLNKWPFSSP